MDATYRLARRAPSGDARTVLPPANYPNYPNYSPTGPPKVGKIGIIGHPTTPGQPSRLPGAGTAGARCRPRKQTMINQRIHSRDPEASVKAALAAWGALTSPLRAVRAFCCEICQCGSTHEVRHCISTGCPLHAFRFGRNPHRKTRPLSAAQRQELTARLRRGRQPSPEAPEQQAAQPEERQPPPDTSNGPDQATARDSIANGYIS